MDPLSLSISVITVLQVSKSIIDTCRHIRNTIKNAESDIACIVSDVESLSGTLEELRDILPTQSSDASVFGSLTLNDGANNERRPVAAVCLGALRSCETSLNEILEKLKPLAKPGLKAKLRWPFDQGSIQEKLETLGKLKGTLHLALSTYQARLLTDQSRKLDGLAKDSKRAEILSWYKTSNPEQNHLASRAKHEPETSKWVFELKEFNSWKETSGESLWLHGIPGAGKTILSSTVIEYVLQKARKIPGARVAYFYFDFSDAKKQSVGNFLKSTIYQLASTDETDTDPASVLYTKCNGLSEPGVDELLDVVLATVAMSRRTYILIDALDECPPEQRPAFLDLFFKNPLPANLSLFITSRKEPDIEAVLGSSATHTVCIQTVAVDTDVRIHVANSILRDAKLSRWKPAVRNKILEDIVKGTNGMFRWAVCQLDTMKKCLTPAMIQAELKGMPETLDETYDRILQAVPSLHQPFVRSALHWLAFANRPLLLGELAEASVINPEDEIFDPDEARLLDNNMILELCGSLVTSSTIQYVPRSKNWLEDKIRIESGSPHPSFSQRPNKEFTVVSLSHFSVKEYMVSQRLATGGLALYHTSERLANEYLASSCLFYLIHFNSGQFALALNFDEWPLLEYAARKWMTHWRDAELDKRSNLQSRTLLKRLFDPLSSDAYVNWLNVSTPDDEIDLGKSSFAYFRVMRTSAYNFPQPLYWGSLLGDVELVEWLIGQGADVNAAGKLGSALGAAAYRGYQSTVNCLLSHGADPNAPNTHYGNVLQVAALGGSLVTTKQLLDAGANINAEGGAYNTALVAAASKEHFDLVKLLIDSGADLNLDSREHGSSLYQAAFAGDIKTVITLLGAGADINEIGSSDGTPLYAAATNGSVPLVQLLIRKSADVNKGGSGRYGYPISMAAKKKHSQVVRILIRSGANINVMGGSRGVTALEAAVESRDVSTFRVLFEAGADPNVHGMLYSNCFHAAIWTGEFEMAKLLLDSNAEFEDRAFLHAIDIYDSNPEFLNRLLQRGPNINAWDEHKGSALHVAVSNRNEPVARVLLERGAYVDAVHSDGSILLLAALQGLKDIVIELLARGANPNRQPKDETPLTAAIYYACTGGQEDLELAEILLQAGANVDGGNGLALYWAAIQGNESIIRFLVEHGANLDLVNDRYKCTALQGAIQKGKASNVDLLLELGANINGPAGENGFVLQYAILSGDESLVRRLLEKGALIDDSLPGASSIRFAVTSRQTSLVPFLLENGADIKAVSPAEALPRWCRDKSTYRMLVERGASFTGSDVHIFVDLIKEGNLEDIKDMLADGMDVHSNNQYFTIIEQAGARGRKDILEIILSHGADINYAPKDRKSALEAACWNSDISTAEFLLQNGADPNLVILDGVTALSTAARSKGNLQLVDLLLDHGSDVSLGDGWAFANACFGGEKILARLLEQPLTPAQRERFLDAALQQAASWAFLDIVSWLLDQGANPCYIGGPHGCPLTAALSNIHISDTSGINNRRLIVDLFLKHGANVNPVPVDNVAPNWDINLDAPTHPPPLVAALARRAASIAKTLLGAGADPNLEGGETCTPLQTAARYCNAMVPTLLSAGANPRAVTSGLFGTALHAAAWTHNVESIRALVAAGADPTVIAGKYGTVLQAAAKMSTVSSGWTTARESVSAMKALVECGADVHARGGKYDNVLQMAAKSGNLEGVRWLVEEMGVDVGATGGRYESAWEAAFRKGHWGIVVYFERHFGKTLKWEGSYNADSKEWKNAEGVSWEQ